MGGTRSSDDSIGMVRPDHDLYGVLWLDFLPRLQLFIDLSGGSEGLEVIVRRVRWEI